MTRLAAMPPSTTWLLHLAIRDASTTALKHQQPILIKVFWFFFSKKNHFLPF